jgi:hypothetical protein
MLFGHKDTPVRSSGPTGQAEDTKGYNISTSSPQSRRVRRGLVFLLSGEPGEIRPAPFHWAQRGRMGGEETDKS